MHISRIARPNFSKFSLFVVCGRGNPSRTSGSVDDVMFSYNWPHGGITLPQQPRCNVVRELTPLLRGIDCILFWSTASAKARRATVSWAIYAMHR